MRKILFSFSSVCSVLGDIIWPAGPPQLCTTSCFFVPPPLPLAAQQAVKDRQLRLGARTALQGGAAGVRAATSAGGRWRANNAADQNSSSTPSSQ
jgi:hypothetical protein